MNLRQLETANELAEHLRQIVKAQEAIKQHNSSSWRLSFQKFARGSMDTNSEYIVDCIGITPMIRFLEEQKQILVKELDALGVKV